MEQRGAKNDKQNTVIHADATDKAGIAVEIFHGHGKCEQTEVGNRFEDGNQSQSSER